MAKKAVYSEVFTSKLLLCPCGAVSVLATELRFLKKESFFFIAELSFALGRGYYLLDPRFVLDVPEFAKMPQSRLPPLTIRQAIQQGKGPKTFKILDDLAAQPDMTVEETRALKTHEIRRTGGG